jgi:hypothetical protein
MRVSFSVASLNDLWTINLGVWDTLRAVQRLTTLAVPKDCKHILTVTFRKKDAERNREDESTTYMGQVETHTLHKFGKQLDLKLEIPRIFFIIPKGCGAEESLLWANVEIAKLAYAMSGGRVSPVNGVEWGVCSKDRDAFVLTFEVAGGADSGS